MSTKIFSKDRYKRKRIRKKKKNERGRKELERGGRRGGGGEKKRGNGFCGNKVVTEESVFVYRGRKIRMGRRRRLSICPFILVLYTGTSPLEYRVTNPIPLSPTPCSRLPHSRVVAQLDSHPDATSSGTFPLADNVANKLAPCRPP